MKYDTEIFVEKAKKVHGNKYDYSKVEYINSTTKVIIICKVHGEFKQLPNSHICGRGCRKCFNDKIRYTKDIFIKKAKSVHGDKYDYSKTEYVNSDIKVKILCLSHGEFEQDVYSHLSGSGCPICASLNKPLTNLEFVEKSKSVHGDKYDYSLVEYKDGKLKVKIICPVHGEFEQVASNHLTGRGCQKCGHKNVNLVSVDNESFINESNKKHNYKYDYTKTNYVNSVTKVRIICPEHGEFEQLPFNHLVGRGCGRCGKSKKIDLNYFIEKSNQIHNFKYDYSLSEYKLSRVKIKIICPIHDIIFEQTPNHHMKGVGCPICSESVGEKTIRILFEKNNINFVRNKKFENCRYKYPLSYDFYLPESNICIEFDGKQHFEAIEYYGGVKNFEEQLIRDNIKNEYCKDNNIELIRIRYDELIEDKLSFLF